MSDPLIINEDFPSVRRAIDASLDKETLPDSLISDPLYLDRALHYIANRTNETGIHAKNAAIFYLGSLLAPAVQGQMMAAYAIHTGGSGSRGWDWKGIAGVLRERAEAELSLIENPDDKTDKSVMLPFFRAASPRRCI